MDRGICTPPPNKRATSSKLVLDRMLSMNSTCPLTPLPQNTPDPAISASHSLISPTLDGVGWASRFGMTKPCRLVLAIYFLPVVLKD